MNDIFSSTRGANTSELARVLEKMRSTFSKFLLLLLLNLVKTLAYIAASKMHHESRRPVGPYLKLVGVDNNEIS